MAMSSSALRPRLGELLDVLTGVGPRDVERTGFLHGRQFKASRV